MEKLETLIHDRRVQIGAGILVATVVLVYLYRRRKKPKLTLHKNPAPLAKTQASIPATQSAPVTQKNPDTPFPSLTIGAPEANA